MPHRMSLRQIREWAQATYRYFRARPGLTALLAVLLLALAIRTYRLNQEAAWYDEISTLQFLRAGSVESFLKECEDLNPVPPIYLKTQFYWGQYVGVNVLPQRMLSILFGMGGLLALYGITRKLFGARAALLTALWTAFVPWHIYYSQEIRFYGMVAFLATISSWVFVWFCETRSRVAFVLLCAMNWIVAWTHPLSVFLFFGQGLFLLIFRRQFIGFIALYTGVHAILGFSLYSFMSGIDWTRVNQLAKWIPMPEVWGRGPGFASYVRVATGYSSPNMVIHPIPYTPLGRALAPVYPFLGWALILIAAAATLLAVRKLVRAEMPAETRETTFPLTGIEKIVILALWFILPPVFAYIASHAWRPVFLDRYIAYAMLPLYIFIGAGLASLRSRSVIAAAYAVPVLIYASFYFPGPYRVPYDKIMKIIREHGTHDAEIYSPYDFVATGIWFYWRGADPPVYHPPIYDELLAGKILPPEDCWFVLSPSQLPQITNVLDPLGETYRVWQLPAVRPSTVVHWRPKNPRPPEVAPLPREQPPAI